MPWPSATRARVVGERLESSAIRGSNPAGPHTARRASRQPNPVPLIHGSAASEVMGTSDRVLAGWFTGCATRIAQVVDQY